MTIYLHKYEGDNRNIFKWAYNNTSPNISKSIEVYDLTSVLYPTVVLDYDSSVLTSGFNYCYISAFKRYYYIVDISVDSGKKIILSLAVDALNTYCSDILKCPATVVRSEDARNSQIYDNQYPISTSEKVSDMQVGKDVFKYTANQPQYVLGVNAIAN